MKVLQKIYVKAHTIHGKVSRYYEMTILNQPHIIVKHNDIMAKFDHKSTMTKVEDSPDIRQQFIQAEINKEVVKRYAEGMDQRTPNAYDVTILSDGEVTHDCTVESSELTNSRGLLDVWSVWVSITERYDYCNGDG